MGIKKKFILLFFLLGMFVGARGQDFAVKTNLVEDALLNANLGAEVSLAPRWSFDLSGQFNGWTVDGHKWKHWLAQPEIRYWFCDHYAGHFVGLHLLGGQYNFGYFPKNNVKFLGTDFGKLHDERHQGWYAGAGIAYGYSFILNKHWNLELELGVGYAYTRYDVFKCEGCGKKVEEDKEHHYYGPTKAAINLVYEF